MCVGMLVCVQVEVLDVDGGGGVCAYMSVCRRGVVWCGVGSMCTVLQAGGRHADSALAAHWPRVDGCVRGHTIVRGRHVPRPCIALYCTPPLPQRLPEHTESQWSALGPRVTLVRAPRAVMPLLQESGVGRSTTTLQVNIYLPLSLRRS